MTSKIICYENKKTYIVSSSKIIIEVVSLWYYRQAAPGAMELADAIDVFNHTFLAIVAGVLALHVDNSDALSYLV